MWLQVLRSSANTLDDFNNVGLVTVTATQSGNSDFQAASPVIQTFNVTKGTLPVGASNVTRPFGADNPSFTYYFGGSGFVPPSFEISGAPVLTTSADTNSPAGQYPIVVTQGTLTSAYWNFQFVSGTLTVLPPASFILTANPTSVTVPRGQARQVTITLTSVNDFIGTVTIGCSGLPAGVTCVSNPSSLTTTLASNGGGVTPVTATLTISTGATVASVQDRLSGGSVLSASLQWFPTVLLGFALAIRRKYFAHRLRTQRLMLLVAALLGLSNLMACGGGSNMSEAAQPGTSVIQVMGSGDSTSGGTTQSVALTVIVQ